MGQCTVKPELKLCRNIVRSVEPSSPSVEPSKFFFLEPTTSLFLYSNFAAPWALSNHAYRLWSISRQECWRIASCSKLIEPNNDIIIVTKPSKPGNNFWLC